MLSLALGIGANTAIFSLVNGLLLRTLPVTDADRLVLLGNGTATTARLQSYPIWEQIQQRRELFQSVASWSFERFNLAAGGETEFVDGLWISGSFFDTLGVPALLGRTVSVADDQRGGGQSGPVAVLSYGFWQRRFGGATDVIGRTLTLTNVPVTVVGVAPPTFFGADVGRTFDVAVPFGVEPLFRESQTRLQRRDAFWLFVIARLRAGQTVDEATAALRAVQPQVREATLPEMSQEDLDRYLAGYLREAFTLLPGATGNSSLRRRYTGPLLTILAAAALVLLVACANVANLLLARAAARHSELSVRVALGASRWRLVRQLAAESVLLSGIGATCGLVIASWIGPLLVRQLSTQSVNVFLTNNHLDVSLDWRVVAFALAVTTATTLLFGAGPAFRASGVAPIEAIKQVRGTTRQSASRLSNGLVVAQVALSVLLLVTAGLFVRTFALLTTRTVGFDRDRVLIATVEAERAEPNADQRLPLYERSLRALLGVPGVRDAAFSIITPVGGVEFDPPLERVSGSDTPLVNVQIAGNYVSPAWFRTFGIPLLAGRDFTDRDRTGSAPVVIVNDAFVRKYLNGANALGQTVTIFLQPPNYRPSLEIVGVVGNSVYGSLRDPERPIFYVPLAQVADNRLLGSLSLGVRTALGSPALLTKDISTAIGTVNPQLALTFRPLRSQLDASLVQERVLAMLSGFFGGLALLLTGLGLYGVTSYSVTARRAELGIRMALGAAPSALVRMVVGRTSMLVGLGLVTGLGLSLWLSPFIASLLYGLAPRDPSSLIGAAVALVVVGAFAAWLPAHRASRLDPAQTLRET